MPMHGRADNSYLARLERAPPPRRPSEGAWREWLHPDDMATFALVHSLIGVWRSIWRARARVCEEKATLSCVILLCECVKPEKTNGRPGNRIRGSEFASGDSRFATGSQGGGRSIGCEANKMRWRPNCEMHRNVQWIRANQTREWRLEIARPIWIALESRLWDLRSQFKSQFEWEPEFTAAMAPSTREAGRRARDPIRAKE